MDAQRALLDQLMGPNRNKVGSEDSESAHWSDHNVCPWYLCGFCPHDLFTNTKEDLGPCSKIHSAVLKAEFEKEKDAVKTRNEAKFLRHLQGLQIRGRQRVARAQDRLKMQAPNHFGDPELRRQQKEIEDMTIDLKNIEGEMEELGEQGKVAEAQEKLNKRDQLQLKLNNLKEQHKIRSNQLESRVKPFIVCETCGGFIVDENPANSRRVLAHNAGRMHQGFSKIFSKVEELEEKLKDVNIDELDEPSPRRSRRSRSRDRGRRTRDRERRRRRRSGSRDRRRERSRSYERERRRSRRH